MIKLDTQRCTGCGACAQVCPEKCIEMSPDRDGFVYPRVFLEKCVSCGKCAEACPRHLILSLKPAAAPAAAPEA